MAKRDGGMGAGFGRARVRVLGFGGAFWESEGGMVEAKKMVRGWAEEMLGFRYPEKDIGEGYWRCRFVVS